jgi:hypothetical protein
LPQLDEKLYLGVFAKPETPAPRRAALSDDAIIEVLEFSHNLSLAFSSHYHEQIQRYYEDHELATLSNPKYSPKNFWSGPPINLSNDVVIHSIENGAPHALQGYADVRRRRQAAGFTPAPAPQKTLRCQESGERAWLVLTVESLR